MSNVNVSVTDRSGRVFPIEASPGTTLMQAMKDRGLPVAAICSGAKSCATCHVFVEEALRGLRFGEKRSDQPTRCGER